MAAVTWLLRSGSLWELLTQSDSNGQKCLESRHSRNSSSCTCFISIPSFKEQRGSIYKYIYRTIYINIYMRKGKNDKKTC